MKISESYRNIILDEINYVLSLMNKTQDADEKLYLFTGVYSTIKRIFNLEYDPELVYTFFILQQTYTALRQRFEAMKTGDKIVLLTEGHFKRLSELTKELSNRIKGDRDLDSTLREFVILAYSTTGNGYYLSKKGLLKI